MSNAPASAHFGPHNPNTQEARDAVKAHGFHFYHGTVNGTEDILALPEKDRLDVAGILDYLHKLAKRNPGFIALDFAATKAKQAGTEDAQAAIAALAEVYYAKTVGNLRELWLKTVDIEEVKLLLLAGVQPQWSEG